MTGQPLGAPSILLPGHLPNLPPSTHTLGSQGCDREEKRDRAQALCGLDLAANARRSACCVFLRALQVDEANPVGSERRPYKIPRG